MGARWAGIALFLLAAPAAWAAFRLRLGTPPRPGPGFFPFWISLGLMGVSLALLLEGRGGSGGVAGRFPPQGLRRVLALTTSLAAFGVLLPFLGFPVTAFGFLLFLWGAMDRQPLPRSALLAGASAAAAYLLFDVVLRVQFPRGPWGF